MSSRTEFADTDVFVTRLCRRIVDNDQEEEEAIARWPSPMFKSESERQYKVWEKIGECVASLQRGNKVKHFITLPYRISRRFRFLRRRKSVCGRMQRPPGAPSQYCDE